MHTSKLHQNYIKTIAILGILWLGSLVGCDRCKPNAEPAAQKENTQPSSTTAASPITPPSPITDAMIQAAEAAGSDYQFLAAKLRALKQAGNNAGIDDVDTTPNTVNEDSSGNAVNCTALHYAVEMDDPDIIRALCTLGANKEAKIITIDLTPLHMAVGKNKLNAVKALLQQPGINVNAKGANKGLTPLMLAAADGYLDILEELLNHPSILLDETDDTGKTALGLAIEQSHPAIEAALKAKNAK